MRKEKDNFEVLMREIAKYIESKGGKAIVLGGISIGKKPPSKNNFTFMVDFTGFPPKQEINN